MTLPPEKTPAASTEPVLTCQPAAAVLGDRASGPLPGFIIIGAAKAGTTSLFEYLVRHPNLYICAEKEPMFFSQSAVYERGFDWYRSLFKHAAEDQIAGEASTCYSRYPHYGDVATKIKNALPDIKLIYMMRQPVERAYSHYGHLMRLNVTHTFEQALNDFPEIIDGSMYMMQIEKYLEHFRRDQMLFLTFDDFKHDHGKVLSDIQQFLGVKRMDLTQQGNVAANVAGTPTAKNRIAQSLRDIRRLPFIKSLSDLCPQSLRSWLHASLTRTLTGSRVGRNIAKKHQQQFSPLTAGTRQQLLSTFKDDTQRLEAFLNRKLPRWHE